MEQRDRGDDNINGERKRVDGDDFDNETCDNEEEGRMLITTLVTIL